MDRQTRKELLETIAVHEEGLEDLRAMVARNSSFEPRYITNVGMELHKRKIREAKQLLARLEDSQK